MAQIKKPDNGVEHSELDAILMASEEPFIAVLEAIGDAVSVQDLEYKIIFTNSVHRRIFGEVAGKYCYDVLHHRDSICEDCQVAEAFRTGQVVRKVKTGFDKSDKELTAEIVAAPIRNREGKIIAGVEVIRDVTDQQRSHLEIQKKRERLERLAAVAKDISSGLDLGRVLQRVVENAAKFSGADAGTIALLDEKRHMIAYPYHYNMPEQMKAVEVPEGAGIAGAVMTSGEPLVFDDYPSHPAQVQAFADAGVKAILAMPLKVRDQALGAIGLFRMKDNEPFSRDDVEIILALADQAAMAIDNARLFDEIVENLRVQKELNRATISITSDLDERKIMSRAVAHVAETVKADASMIALLDEERNLIAFPYAVGLPEELTRFTIENGQGVSGRVIKSGEPLITSDYPNSPDSRPEFVAAGVKSAATVPLKVGNHVIGAIGVMEKKGHREFTRDDLDILSIISAETAVALENARLYRELQGSAQKLEQRVKERTDALSRMYQESENKGRELEEANIKLREVDRLKSEFLANMSHELRTPLNSIIGFSKLIIDGLDGDVNEEQQRDLEIVHRNGHELLRLIDDLLNLAKIEAGRVTLMPNETDVGDLVQDALISLSSSAAEKSLKLSQEVPPGLKPVLVDAAKIRQILFNLIGNAIKFTEAGTIKVAIEQTPEETIFSVADTGIGIKAEEIPVVFDRFHQVSPGMASAGGGVGLGLTISKRFVEMHGGRIWAESEYGQGSTFSFAIPTSRAAGAISS